MKSIMKGDEWKGRAQCRMRGAGRRLFQNSIETYLGNGVDELMTIERNSFINLITFLYFNSSSAITEPVYMKVLRRRLAPCPTTLVSLFINSVCIFTTT